MKGTSNIVKKSAVVTLEEAEKGLTLLLSGVTTCPVLNIITECSGMSEE